jgi:hypothetical protein
MLSGEFNIFLIYDLKAAVCNSIINHHPIISTQMWENQNKSWKEKIEDLSALKIYYLSFPSITLLYVLAPNSKNFLAEKSQAFLLVEPNTVRKKGWIISHIISSLGQPDPSQFMIYDRNSRHTSEEGAKFLNHIKWTKTDLTTLFPLKSTQKKQNIVNQMRQLGQFLLRESSRKYFLF